MCVLFELIVRFGCAVEERGSNRSTILCHYFAPKYPISMSARHFYNIYFVVMSQLLSSRMNGWCILLGVFCPIISIVYDHFLICVTSHRRMSLPYVCVCVCVLQCVCGPIPLFD